MPRFLRLIRAALSSRNAVSLRLTGDVEATIYDCPGKWMGDADLDRLRDELKGVAMAAIPGELTYGVFSPSRAPYENRLVVVGRHLGRGEAIGFNAMPRLTLSVDGKTMTALHLGLLVIHPKYQRQGFQGLLYGLGGFSALHRIREPRVWVSNVTEVPSVFGAVADNFLDVFPHYERQGPPPALHRRIAEAIMAEHRHEFGVGPEAVFDAERFVIQGSYTGGSDALKKSFTSAAKYRAPAANAFCERELDYTRGDDFLQVGCFDATVITNWLTRRIPEGLRPQTARQMKLWTYR